MSVWEREEHRLLLLELVIQGTVRERRSQAMALRQLQDVRWIRRTTRGGEWALEPHARSSVEGVLDRYWDDWRDVQGRLSAAGLPPTPQGWIALRDRERLESAHTFPAMLHRKTYAAAVGEHSKVRRTPRRSGAEGAPLLTSDQVVRVRPCAGLELRRGSDVLDAVSLARLNGGEVVLTERALLAGTTLAGRAPDAMLLVENLGAYVDLAPPDGWLVVHVPGWDSSLVRTLVRGFDRVPLVHFGDLDPEGVRITAHLKMLFPDLRWFVPSFAPEYFEGHARRCTWPQDLPPLALPVPVDALVRTDRWLEQEVLSVDPRCAAELAAFVRP